jgi:hypothetical protein
MRWLRLTLCSFLFIILVLVGVFSAQRLVLAQTDGDEDTQVIRVRRNGRELQTRIAKEAPDPDLGRP